MTDCSVFPQMLPQRCTWLYVMNNVLMSVSGNTSVHMLVVSENTECCILSAALTKCPSCREVLAALFAQSDGSVWTERTGAEETQQSVAQHQPLHGEDQPPVGQDINYRKVVRRSSGTRVLLSYYCHSWFYHWVAPQQDIINLYFTYILPLNGYVFTVFTELYVLTQSTESLPYLWRFLTLKAVGGVV